MFLWKNWGGNQTCNAKIITPKDEAELIQFMQEVDKNSKIHAFGSSHAWSDITCAKDYLISTHNLNKIININKDKKLVRVQGGIKLHELNEHLAKENLSLKNQAQITNQTLAGAVCVGTHGSGNTGTFSSFVKEVKLLTPLAKVYNISENENADFFPAARTNIGTLGIVTEYTVECTSLFKTKIEHAYCDWQTILNEYEFLLQNNDFIEFSYHIKDDGVKIRTNNIVDIQTPIGDNVDYGYKNLTGLSVLNYLPSPGSLYYEEEIAVPIKHFKEAALEFKNFILKKFNKHSFVHILIRFTKAENNNWLNTSSDHDSAYFSITTLPEYSYEQTYKEFYDLMLKYNGRPHWAKLNFLIKQDAQKVYSNNFDNFLKVRKIIDPNLTFSNGFTQRVFGE